MQEALKVLNDAKREHVEAIKNNEMRIANATKDIDGLKESNEARRDMIEEIDRALVKLGSK